MSQLTLYGIANCDTIKKAKKWLDGEDIEYVFHDYRASGLERKLLEVFAAQLGWESILNRRGTTWRKLSEETKNSIDRHSAIDVMLEHPAMIKRPILGNGSKFLLGFDEQKYREFIQHK
ncbi:MAG: ArsC family reductase [Pseudomonadota bacterium]